MTPLLKTGRKLVEMSSRLYSNSKKTTDNSQKFSTLTPPGKADIYEMGEADIYEMLDDSNRHLPVRRGEGGGIDTFTGSG